MVASGYIDLVVEADLKAYDVGGLIPLVEEAGGCDDDLERWSSGNGRHDRRQRFSTAS
jgi:fructose-1,6-bisphosphatase/inositol monophosphatase family enzyme